MKKGKQFLRRTAVGLLSAVMLCCNINFPAKADEGEVVETQLLNLDFSNSTVGGSIAGNGSSAWGRVVGVVDGSSTTVAADEDGTIYGNITVEETANAGKNVGIVAFTYKATPYDDIIVRIRTRIHDYNSNIDWMFRQAYDDDNGAKKEQVTTLLSMKQGVLKFLDTTVDSSVWETPVEGQEPTGKLPLDTWMEFAVSMDLVNHTATLAINGVAASEAVAYADNGKTDLNSTGNNFRVAVTRPKNAGATSMDMDYFRVSSVTVIPPFDPWTRIQLTDTQAALVDTLLANNEEAHPSLYFSADEIPALREKIKQGRSLEAWKLLEEDVAAMLEEIDLDTYAFDTALSGRKLQKEVGYLTFYGYLAEREDCVALAKALLLKAAGNLTAEQAFSLNDVLAVGDVMYGLVLGYDWLYHQMTEEERTVVEGAIVEYGNFLFDRSFTDAFGSEEVKRLVWNWNSVTHGPLGMAALLLDDGAIGENDMEIRKEWLSRSIQRMEGYCIYSKDATGMSYEGLSYLGYGMNSLVPLAAIINSRTGANWLDQFDHLKAVPTYQMQMNAPYGNQEGYFMNQGTMNGHFATTYYLINLFGDQEGLWGFDKAGYFANYATGLGWNGNCCQLPLIITFEDPTLEPVKPTETYKLFEQGVVVGRDGFEDTSAMFTFRSAQGNQSTWNHPDTNTFGFWAKGEAFVVDAGAGYKAGWQHNIVMADGVGLDAEGGSYNCPGRIVKTEDLGNAVYVLGDATESYKNKVKAIKADRHAVFGRGENPYVFTYDDFSIDGAEHAYAVHYMTNGDNELVLLEDASGYQIKGGNIGGQCFALFFDDKDVNVALEDVNESFKSTVAQVSDTNLSMGALFIAADRYGKLPTVRKTMTENGMKLELYLADNRLDVITVENGVASYESTVYTEKPAGDGVIDLSVYETEVELTDITVTTLPQKTEYTEGESFDKTGMVVTAHYSDGSTRTVADYTIDKTGALKVTDTEILITYAEKGIEKNAIVAIKVSPGIHETEVELTDITVTTLPQKTEYTEGESFDKTGMVVTAHYSDGSTRIVADYTIDKTGALKVTDTEILITYAEKGIEKTIAVAIKVSPNQQNNNDNNGSGNEDNKENDSTGNLPDNGEGKLSPQTGAESRLLLWLGMAFFAGTALVFLFLSRKKKDR